MKREYRIAHFSDLHLSPEYFPERSILFRSALEQCRKIGIDHYIITGDVTNQARPVEFGHFRSILEEFSLLDAEKTTVVIGNHDIFGGPYYADDVLNFPSDCKSTEYDKKVSEFFSATKETFRGVTFFSSKTVFPFLKLIGDTAIVGINSIARWNGLKNPIGSNGKIYDDQFKCVSSILKSSLLEGKRIIVAMHHHFYKINPGRDASRIEQLWTALESTTMKLRGEKKLLALFRKAGVEMILHGHVHHTTEYRKNGIRCVNAGGTVMAPKDDQPAFHVLTFNEHGVRLETTPIQQLQTSPVKRHRQRPAATPILVNA